MFRALCDIVMFVFLSVFMYLVFCLWVFDSLLCFSWFVCFAWYMLKYVYDLSVFSTSSTNPLRITSMPLPGTAPVYLFSVLFPCSFLSLFSLSPFVLSIRFPHSPCVRVSSLFVVFDFLITHIATPALYILSLTDALPILPPRLYDYSLTSYAVFSLFCLPE